MATMQKITVTVPTEWVASIRGLVSEGKADSVSGFVQHAIEVALDDVAGWGAMLAHALQETGGDMTPEERAWADRVLGVAEAEPGSAA
ncbi:MAG: hypothetical protein QM619_09500 [Micropruina sp.]|uniref:hypothetical protein n=1 Tax=Micropruina sp. TaxID=2737536 RepID=UPI0039E6DF00